LGSQASLSLCRVKSSLEQTKELIAIYRDTAQEEGYEMKPEPVGYLIASSS
jgi:hypothetical protein